MRQSFGPIKGKEEQRNTMGMDNGQSTPPRFEKLSAVFVQNDKVELILGRVPNLPDVYLNVLALNRNRNDGENKRLSPLVSFGHRFERKVQISSRFEDNQCRRQTDDSCIIDHGMTYGTV